MKVRVKFPDGIREVEASLQSETVTSGGLSFGDFVYTPLPIKGWRFERVWSDVQWEAYEDNR